MKPTLFAAQTLYRNRYCHILSLVLTLFSTASFSEQIHWQSPAYIRDSLLNIALNNEYSSNTSTLRKWTSPIYYTIYHRTSDQALHQQITDIHLQHLANITGVTITAAESEQQTNLKIIFSSEKQLMKELEDDFLLKDRKQINSLARHSVCLAHFSINPDSSIKQAIVIIPVDRARAHAKLLSCVVEELTQIMGLPNDSDKVFPSVFNDHSSNDFLSGLDFLLLKLLYAPQLKVGTKKSEVSKVIDTLINDSEFQKMIGEAEKKVSQQGLYQLLNR